MMDEGQDLLERLQRVFRELSGDESLRITETTTPADVPEWDSMFQVTLTMAIEKEFGLRLSAKDASQLVSVKGILNFLENKLSQRVGG